MFYIIIAASNNKPQHNYNKIFFFHIYFPFEIQAKLGLLLLINFNILSLYQGVKRKQALLGSNLSAIITLTVCSNAILGGGNFASFFVLLTLSIWLRNPKCKSYRKQTFHSRLLIFRESCKFLY
jgi:hypothetical protein